MFDSTLQRRPLPWHALICTAILILFSTIWVTQAAFADDAEIIGQIEVMPEEGLIGAWQVDGFAFVTVNTTEFRTEKGEFAIGRCVEVEYMAVGEQTVATKVVTKSSDDCRNDDATASVTPTVDATSTAEPTETEITPTATVSVTPSPSATDDDDDHETERIRALIDALPDDGFRGVWTIGGIEYQITAETQIRQKEGPVRVGACVEVHYRMDGEFYRAMHVETEHRRKCHHDGTPTPGSTVPAPTTTVTVTPEPSSTPDDDDENEIIGLLDSFPADLIGEWVIAGEAYTATASTEFEEDRGQFVAGACVKAHLLATDPAIIREVETTNRFRCGGSDDGSDDGQAHGALYGVIQEFPTELIGDWQIGGLTIVADAATEFEQRRGAFAEGVTVEVHFVVQTDGTFYATKIEAKFANDHGGDDDDDNDVYEGAEGHAYGLIGAFPEDLIGEWLVGGITYTVTSDTHFVLPHSDFAVDVMVRVKYRTDAEGNRVARQIKTTRGNGGANREGHATLFGYVDQMPVNGFVGEWIIDGVAFAATVTTKFKEEHGVLGLGSYVKMEYFISEGDNVLHEIESEVPPGAGDDTTVGEIETIEEEPDDSLRASTGTRVNAATWTIGGQAYVVTAATDLNDFQGELVVGNQAVVNSYTAEDGTLVATQIRGVTLNNTIYLPSINR